MKIKKVELSNINSLAGNWNIDFESEDFANSSMYCISGPTGSGKTSILDAICLALYGLTPRQERINSTVNEIMTYGTMECFAKVTFECKGAVYSACWSQHRAARTKKLQGYSWVLIDEATQENKASFSNQKDIEEKMKNLIGLDFDQFTKSMMLAQGEFNKFLKCNENERAAILEKLTGDEIYRKIAIAVHDLYANAEDAVGQVKIQMGENQPLSEEDRKKLDDDISESEKQKKVLTDTVERLGKICSWYETLHENEKMVQKAAELQSVALKAKEDFKSSESKLKAALDAQEIEPAFATLCEKRKAVEENSRKLSEAEDQLPKAKATLDQMTTARKEKAAALEAAKKTYSDGEILWEKVSALDVQIKGAREKLNVSQEDCIQKQKELDQAQQNVTNNSAEIEKNHKLLEAADSYIQQHGKDAEIEAKMSLFNSKNRELKDRIAEQAKVKDEFVEAQKALTGFDASLENKKQTADSANKYLDAHKEDVNLGNVLPQAKSLAKEAENHQQESTRLQDAINAKNDSIEKFTEDRRKDEERLESLKAKKEVLIQNDLPVVVLELRENLKAGAECPVCGSKDHPACDGHEHPVTSGIESLNDLANGLRELGDEIGTVQNGLNVLDEKITAAKTEVADNTQKLKNEKSKTEDSLAELNGFLSSWKKDVTLENARSILNELETLFAEYQKKKDSADTLGRELNEAEVIRAQKVHAEADARNRLDDVQSKIQELSDWFREQLSSWFSSIEDASIDALLVELQAKNSEWQRQQKNRQDCSTVLASLNSQKVELETSLGAARDRLDTSRKILDEADKILKDLVQSRKELFGDKSVDVERQAARNLQNAAEQASAQAVDAEQKSRETVNSIEKKIEDLQEALGGLKPELVKLQAEFVLSLAAKNFADESDFAAARLSSGERKVLSEKRDSIEHQLTVANTSVTNAGEILAAHQAKRDFEETEESAKAAHGENRQKLDDFNSNYTALLASQKADDVLREKFAGLQKQLTQLTEKRDRWAQMQKWFNGSKLSNSTGNEFVRFIQIITLKNLLKTANTHLRDMFPRYELTVKNDSLDIMLIDHDNSDAIRPISNISGGEGFLVSLSLALGISTLTSKNVSIDSMFLDEGFGTLDAKILQDTIVVLQKMQQEKGKMLGVITHVDIVKEELKKHVEVLPQGGGRSILRGAGVSHG